MFVFRYNDSASAPGLVIDDCPVPTPRPGEVLVRVHAAGVTPTELCWYPSTHNLDGTPRTGAILGHEFSGTIEAVGPGGDETSIGRAVFGMNDWFADGATADFCLAPLSSIATKPTDLSFAECAAVPIGALTAWQGLITRAKVKRGERVLIHGGSGAVGIFAIQLARDVGTNITTTASARNREFLKDLGAHEVIDYHTERFETSGGGFDVIFDCIGGDTLRRSWPLLAPEGRMVTIAAASEGTSDERTRNAFFIVQPDGTQLGKIAGLLEYRSLCVFVNILVPFSDASAAYVGTLPGKLGYGKTVIVNSQYQTTN